MRYLNSAIDYIPSLGCPISDPLKDPRVCGRPECDENNNKFRYKSGIKYRYDYRSHVRSEFQGTGQNKSDVYVTASLVLIFPKKCEGILTLQDVELRETPLYDDSSRDTSASETNLHMKSYSFATDLERYELRYVDKTI